MSTHTPLSAPSWTTWTHLTNSLPALILLAFGIILIAAVCWLRYLAHRLTWRARRQHSPRNARNLPLPFAKRRTFRTTRHSISPQTGGEDTVHLWRRALATKYAQDTAAFLAAQTMWQIARDTAARYGPERRQRP